MGFNQQLKIVGRVLLITALLVVMLWAGRQEGWYITTATAGMLAAGAVAELIVWLGRSQRELNRFLLLLRHRDYSAFNAAADQVPGDYRPALAAIASDFRTVRLEKERHYQFLIAVTHHIRTALICFNPQGNILLANQAMHGLLGATLLNHLRQVERVSEALLEVVKTYAGDGAVSLVLGGKLHRMSVHRSEIVLDKEHVTIVSLREIGAELDGNEQEAWQKLFGVLTHEIMNSVTPIASLCQAADRYLQSHAATPAREVVLPTDDFADLAASIGSINQRSQGLLRFVGAYKSLTTMPHPRITTVVAADLVRYASNLLGSTFAEKGIVFHTRVFPSGLTFPADEEMMQRVLINLLLNAMYATEEIAGGRINLEATLSPSERTLITVSDNGRGIAPEHLDKIFVPFFTTRKGGSGLGLSVSREIIRLHRGQIRVKSRPGEGTSFEVLL